MTEAIENGMVSVVKYLINHCGVKVNDEDLTPLQLAARLGQSAFIDCLLDHGASIDMEVYEDGGYQNTPSGTGECDFRQWNERPVYCNPPKIQGSITSPYPRTNINTCIDFRFATRL